VYLSSFIRKNYASKKASQKALCTLLEDLALAEGGPATKAAVPGEVVLNELLVLGRVVVQLLPVVVGVVIHLLHLLGHISTTEEPDGGNLEFGFLAKDGQGAEAVLPQPVQTLDEAAKQVSSHEQLLALIVVLVVTEPEGIAWR